MKFLMYTEGTDNRYAFRLLSETGTTLLQSSEFPDRDACVATMRNLIQTLPNANAYSIGAQGSFSVRNTEGVVLASSPAYANRGEAQAAVDFLSDDAADERQYAVELRTTTTQTVAGNAPPVLPSLSAIDFTSLYDFGVASPSRIIGLNPYQKKEDSLHYFCYYDNGEALLYGRGFDSGVRRDKRIRQVIAAAPKEQRWEIVQDGNEYYFILKEKNGLEIARSRRFGSRADAQTKMSLMQGALPGLAAQYPEPDKKKKSNHYDFTLRSATEKGFANLRGEDKGYYFILNNDSNQPVLFSQNYSGSGARMGGVRSVVKSLTDEQYIERHEKGGKHYFLVKATNKQEIAHSAFFDSKEEMERSVRWLRSSSGAWVTQYGVDMTPKEAKTKTVTETENFTLDVERPKSAAPIAAAAALAATVIPEIEIPKVETPKVDPAIAAAALAAAAAAAIPKVEVPKVEPKKVIVDVPKAEPIVAAKRVVEAAAPIAPVVETGGGFKWWWLLGLLALIPLFFLVKGCPQEEVKVVPPPTPPVVETPAPAATPAPEPTPAPVAAPANCDLNWILFDFDKANILSEARKELASMAKILIDNPSYVGVLHAHTDAKGSVAYNEDLSKRRAKNAKAVLVEMGIDADRIKTSASGKGDPFAKNTEDDTGRRFNRRVELFIQDKSGKDVCTSIPPTVAADLKAK
jgi:outer membrane protein OmpA-like peptidoglycan-associated protein/uncharacterized protein YegP (UPF0339 family)